MNKSKNAIVIEKEEWLPLHAIPVIMARFEGKRKHPDTSSWAAAAVGWMSSALPPGKFTLHFHSTSFLQGKSKVTQPISVIMLIHSSLHSPARSLRTTLNQHCWFVQIKKHTELSELGTATSLTAGAVLVSWGTLILQQPSGLASHHLALMPVAVPSSL